MCKEAASCEIPTVWVIPILLGCKTPLFFKEFLWNHVRFEKWGAVNNVPISVVVVVLVVVAAAVVVLIPSPVFCCLNLSVQMVEIM